MVTYRLVGTPVRHTEAMFETREPTTRADIRQAVLSFGANLTGIVGTDRLEQLAPGQCATIASSMRTFVVFAKRTLRGISWSRHLQSKQIAGGHTMRALDHIGSRLCHLLEGRGYPSLPVPAGFFDFEKRVPEDVTPAGQGSYLLRLAAVEAGLGTWGLNNMVLTPEFGPRVYFGGAMTELEVENDQALQSELCLGLEECGRCAAICPEDAIPRQARVGAELHTYRGLDRAACCRSSQPFGFGAFINHASEVVQTLDSAEMWERVLGVRGRKTGEVWAEMAIMKEGSITGCSQCVQVCPVGADYDDLKKSPHRQQDLPENLPRDYSGGFVKVEHIGPTSRRGWVANEP